MYNCPRCVDRFQPVVAKKEKNEIAKLLSWFLMLSKIMAQPYDDTFNIEGTQKLQTDYHTTLHLCPTTGYPDLESVITSYN